MKQREREREREESETQRETMREKNPSLILSVILLGYKADSVAREKVKNKEKEGVSTSTCIREARALSWTEGLTGSMVLISLASN